MSTNSSIIRKTDNGYEGIYCHWDGDEDGVGETLKTNFNTEKDARDIIALGSCSQIAACVRIRPIGIHSYANPEKGTIIAYHRDRQDEGLYISKGKTLREVIDNIGIDDFVYVFENGEWNSKHNFNE